MAITVFADIQNLVNQIYERALFVAREQNLMSQLVDTRSATGWMARTITERPKAVAEEVADGQDYANAQKFDKKAIATITPKEAIAQFILSDRYIETDPDGARDDAATELGNAIAEKIDKDLVALFTNATKDKGPGAGAAASLATVAAGLAVLRNNVAPGPKTVVLHPYQWHRIWLELGQPVANYAFLGEAANQALREYFVGGPLVGARWFVSANIPVDANNDAVGGIFVPRAIVLDVRRRPRLEAERDASLRAWELNMTAGYGVGIVKQDYIVKYTSDASEP